MAGMSRARVAVLKVVSRQLSATDAAAEYGYSRRHLHRLLAAIAKRGSMRLSRAHAVRKRTQPLPQRRFASG